LAIHNAFRSGSTGKLLIENPLAVELLQPGTQQPGIFLETDSLLSEFRNNIKLYLKIRQLFFISRLKNIFAKSLMKLSLKNECLL